MSWLNTLKSLGTILFTVKNQKQFAYSVDDSPESMARLREDYFNRESVTIRGILEHDLRKYITDEFDISRIKLFTLEDLVPKFLEMVTDMHSKPIQVDMEGGSEKEQKNLESLLKEVLFDRFIKINNRKTLLHGTLVVFVRYVERIDKIYFETLHQGNCIVVPYNDYVYEPKIVAIPFERDNKKWFEVWDKEKGEYYETTKFQVSPNGFDIKSIAPEDKIPVGSNSNISAPDYFPFVTYRTSDLIKKFWGSGMDSLIELERIVNIIFTIMADDTVQETIRLLLLNFNPSGVETEDGKIKVGLRHPLYPEDNLGLGTSDIEPDGKVLSADLFNNEIIETVREMVSMTAALHGVQNMFKTQDMQRVYAAALKIAMLPRLQKFREDVGLLEEFDTNLIKTVIKVHSYHRVDSEPNGREKRISDKAVESIKLLYNEPDIDEITYTMDDRIKRWNHGLSNPAKDISKARGISIEEAEKEVKENLDFMNKYFYNKEEDGEPDKTSDNDGEDSTIPEE